MISNQKRLLPLRGAINIQEKAREKNLFSMVFVHKFEDFPLF